VKMKLKLILCLAAALLAMGLLMWGNFLPGQQTEENTKVYRLGIITSSDLQQDAVDGFKEKMTQLGYTEGVNVNYDFQNPKGDRNLTKQMAKDLVAKKLDLYVPFSTTGTKAMQDALKGTGFKMVFGDVSNYKELGIENLLSPHKNMKGATSINIVYSEKRMQILKEVVPDAKIFGIIWNPTHVSFNEIKKLNEDAARNLNVSLLIAEGTTNEETLASIKSKFKRGEVDGVIITSDTTISGQAEKIAEYLRQEKIPSIDFSLEKGISSGYLVTYGTSRKELGKQTAVMVDKVLKGASVDDLPIEFPAVIELQLNARLAKEMGIEFPQALLYQATVIKND
jgi:putative ABC transport system substrate-binding protein